MLLENLKLYWTPTRLQLFLTLVGLMFFGSFAQNASVVPLPPTPSSSPVQLSPVPADVESSFTPDMSPEASAFFDPFNPPDASPCPTILPIPTVPVSRIVGGGPVPPPTFLHMASLDRTFLFPSLSFGICSATLLSPRWALTAAHCVNSISIFHLRLRVAALDAGEHSPQDGPTIRIIATHQAPRQLFRPDIELDADLALLYLSDPIPSNYTFARVNANPNLPEPSAFARAVGYGRTRRFSFKSNRPLLQVDIPTVPNDVCEDSWYMTENNMCAGYEFSECGVCNGDSGGPLLQYAPDGHPVIVGVTSRGVGCGSQGIADNYMRVSSFLQWFDEIGVEYENSTDAEQVFAPVRLPEAEPSPSPGPTCPVVLEQIPARTLPPLPKMMSTGSRVWRQGASESTSEFGRGMAVIRGRYSFVSCSGVLLSRKWVLTSTACLVGAGELVYIGGGLPGLGYPALVDRIFPGENSTSFSTALATNVTLLRLSDSTPDLGVHALVNTDKAAVKPGAFGKVFATGLEQPLNSTDLARLRQVDLPLQNLATCRRLRNETVPPGLICAGYQSGACGLCQSRNLGGPIVMFDKKDRPVVVGLNAGRGGCDVPDVFVGVHQFVKWMRAVGAEFETTDEVVRVESHVQPDPQLVPSPSPSPFFFPSLFSETPFPTAVAETGEARFESPEPKMP